MIALNPLTAFSHTDVEAVLMPITMGLIPSKLPLAGISLALLAISDWETGNIFLSRFCKEISNQPDEILAYLRGARSTEWARLFEVDSDKYFKSIDARINDFSKLKEVADTFKNSFAKYTPVQALTDPLGKSAGELVSMRDFSRRLMYGSGAYTEELIAALDNDYRKLFGYQFPPGNYGPVGTLMQAHRLIRDIIAGTVIDFQGGLPLQVIRSKVQSLAAPLVPFFIAPEDEKETINVDQLVISLANTSSPIDTLKAICENPILVADALYFQLPDMIKLDLDMGFRDGADVLKRRYSYIKHIRSELIRSTPNFEDVPGRLAALFVVLDKVRSDIENDTVNEANIIDYYTGISNEFPEARAFFAAQIGESGTKNEALDLPEDVLKLTQEAEEILKDKSSVENYYSGIEKFDVALSKLNAEIQPIFWAAVASYFSAVLLGDRSGTRERNLERAIMLLEKATEVLPRIDQFELSKIELGEILWGSVHGHLGNAYSNRATGDKQANVKRAMYHLNLALSFFHEIKNPLGWAVTQINLGSAYAESRPSRSEEQIKTLIRAVICFENALRVYTEDEFSEDRIGLKLNLSRAIQELRSSGLGEQEIQDFVVREKYALDSKSPSISLLKEHISQAGLDIPREVEEAINHIEANYSAGVQDLVKKTTTEKLSRSTDNLSLDNRAQFLTESAMTLIAKKDGDHNENVKQAIETLQESASLLKKENDLLSWARTHYNIGTAFLDILLHKQGVSIADYLMDTAGLPRSYPRFEEQSKMVEHYQHALQVFTPINEPLLTRRMGQRSGDLYFRHRDWAEAVDAYRLAIDADVVLYESALITETKDRVIRETSDIEFGESGNLYSNTAFALAKLNRVEEAFGVLELGKARLIRETLGFQELDLLESNDKDELIAIRKETQEILEVLEDPSGTGQGFDNINVLISSLEKINTRKKRLIEHVRKYVPTFLEINIVSETIADLLPERTALIELVVTYQGAIAFVVQKRNMFRRKNIVAVELENLNTRKIRLFTRGHEDALLPGSWLSCLLRLSREGSKNALGQISEFGGVYDFASFSNTAAMISECFWKDLDPLLEANKVEHIVLILQDDLKLFPFHSGLIVKGENRYDGVLEKYDCSYSPSSLAWQKSRALDRGRPDSIVILCNPVDLDYAELEAWIIAEIFSRTGKTATILTTNVLEKSQIIESIRTANILHFCGHAKYDWGNPRQSGLNLSTPGKSFIGIKDIWHPDFFSDLSLAFLSGCTTTMFDFQTGLSEEYIGLPAAFIGSGAKAVIGSLWRVKDLTALLFSIAFYRNWVSHKTENISRALAETQRWMRLSKGSNSIELLEEFQNTCRRKAANGDELSIRVVPMFTDAMNKIKTLGEVPFGVFDWATFQVVGDALQSEGKRGPWT